MYLVDKYGWPYEKRKGRPIHNFIRACILLLLGKLQFKSGKYMSSTHELIDNVQEKVEET